MKTAILCISDPYYERGKLLKDYYKKRGDEVLILTPDYSHRYKRLITDNLEDTLLIHHMPYKRNLSWQRLYGHYDFARSCYKKLQEWQPDRIHCLVPANSLALFMARYKKEHPEVQLYLDVNDLWPESLPLGFLEKLPPARVWQNYRNHALKEADLLFTECDLFDQILHEQTGVSSIPLYWARKDPMLKSHPVWTEDVIHAAYLGSINNIIDLDLMESFFARLNEQKPVILHIVGDGERKEEMVLRLKKAGVKVMDHGTVFDPAKKQEIFDLCRFGINMMKDSVLAGLPMKSLDYLAAGLPLLNSSAGDLKEICLQEKAGIYVDRLNMDKAMDTILAQDQQEHMFMRQKAQNVFQNKFSLKHFEDVLDQAIQHGQQKKIR